jgi:hypothetical protein
VVVAIAERGGGCGAGLFVTCFWNRLRTGGFHDAGWCRVEQTARSSNVVSDIVVDMVGGGTAFGTAFLWGRSRGSIGGQWVVTG